MPEEYEFFLLYVAIVSFQFHPGMKERMTPKEALAESLRFWREYKKCSEVLWPGLVPRSEELPR